MSSPTVTPLARAASQRLRSTFGALQHRNFRLFLSGQFISLCGTWIQQVALGWLVLELTNSAFAVGLVSTLGSLPILFFTLYGGVVADRVDKRRFVILLQALMLCEAVSLGILTAFHMASVTWVMGLAIFAGLLSAFEVPARQALIVELVGREDLMNAIALNSSAFNLARVIGPVIAGILIAGVGMPACFFANAVSYVAVLVGLVMMRTKPRPVQKEIGAVTAMAEGLRFIWNHRWPRALVILIAGFSLFGFPFMTMLPVYARDVLHVGASGYAVQLTAIGVGAAIAALSLAGLGQRTRPGRLLFSGSLLFGVTLVAAALFPNHWAALGLFTLAGWTMALNGILGNTMLQTEAPDHLRGRVMGVYSFLVLGLAPFGSLQAGFISEHFGVRWSVGLGGFVCVVVAVGVACYMAGGAGRLYRAARQLVA